MCGTSYQTLDLIWYKIKNAMGKRNAHRNILIALHFLKNYPIEIVGAAYWRLRDEKYYSRIVWQTITIMYSTLQHPNLSSRLFQPNYTGLFEGIFLIVDCTECPIQPIRQSWATQRVFYSGKKKMHTLKYQLAVTLNTGTIVSYFGPYPGSVHDKLIMDRWCSTYEHELKQNELCLGDKGYIGQERCLVPYKKSQSGPTEKQFNFILGDVRCLVEQTIQRVKVFQCVSTRWRHDLYKHHFAFTVCCILANYSIEQNPIRNEENKLLFV